MARLIGLVLAVAAGLAAAVLLGSGVTATDADGSALVGIAVLACIAAGTVGVFAGRDPQPA